MNYMIPKYLNLVIKIVSIPGNKVQLGACWCRKGEFGICLRNLQDD